MLRNSCLIDGNMITPSENFADSSNLCSLCERCIAENKTNRNWDCEDKNSTPFIRNKIFYKGEYLCGKKHNADCVYKYADCKVIAIEIKDRPLGHIKEDEKEGYPNLVNKIEDCYGCSCDKELTLIVFVLQLSSIKNSSKGKLQLLAECEKGLNANNIRIGKNGKLVIKKNNLKHTNVKFDIVKCKELNDKYFGKLLNFK